MLKEVYLKLVNKIKLADYEIENGIFTNNVSKKINNKFRLKLSSPEVFDNAKHVQ
jgi:hypothetical protein